MSEHRPYLEWSMGAAGPVLAALDNGDDVSWQDRAACAETDPDAFFPEPGGSAKWAKQVCRACGVRAECLEYAMANPLLASFGIWGGLSSQERRQMRRGLADAA